MTKKENKDINWLFDEYGNLLKRPPEISKDKKKKKTFEYSIIEAESKEKKNNDK